MLEEQVPLGSVGPFQRHCTVHRQCAANLSARRTLNGGQPLHFRGSQVFLPLLLVFLYANDFIKESLMTTSLLLTKLNDVFFLYVHFIRYLGILGYLTPVQGNPNNVA